MESIPYRMPARDLEEMRASASACLGRFDARRSVRDFSSRPVPRDLIASAIQAASTAPSGAHRQPWKFVAVSNADIKHQIRIAAEKEEYESYEGGRMPEEWKQALEPIGTNWQKPFLETVPWIVVVFEEIHGVNADGSHVKN